MIKKFTNEFKNKFTSTFQTFHISNQPINKKFTYSYESKIGITPPQFTGLYNRGQGVPSHMEILIHLNLQYKKSFKKQ